VASKYKKIITNAKNMLTLYAFPTCPYCTKVRDFLNENNISFEEIDATEPENEKKLIELGGKRQVPYLVDDEHNVAMYESDAIINFLKETYTK